MRRVYMAFTEVFYGVGDATIEMFRDIWSNREAALALLVFFWAVVFTVLLFAMLIEAMAR